MTRKEASQLISNHRGRGGMKVPLTPTGVSVSHQSALSDLCYVLVWAGWAVTDRLVGDIGFWINVSHLS